MTSATDIDDRIARVTALIAAARRMMADDDRPADLSALEERVRDLCDVVRAAEPDTANAARSTIVALQTDLQSLGDEMQARLTAISQRLDFAERSTAIRAYDRATPAQE